MTISFSVLALGVTLSAWRATEKKAPVKIMDDYWTESGIGTDALEELVDDDSCRSSQRYFLACANAVLTVADRLGLQVSFDGHVTPAIKPQADLTEKRLLEPWSEFYKSDVLALQHLSFRKIWQTITENHISQERLAALTGTALNGFLSVFRDPHTYILPIRYYQEVLAKSNASSSALGIVLARSPSNYYLRKVIEGSPSAAAGLKRGDWVLSVNGVLLKDLPPQRLGEMLKGSDPAKVTRLEIRRAGKKFFVEIPRTKTEVSSVVWKKSDGLKPVGILTIHKFAHDTCIQTRKALDEMNAADMRGVIVDLRDNSGGQMDEAACIISLFIGPGKTAFSIRYLDPSKEAESYVGSEPQIWTKAVAIVINGGTASASEILAGSLRDHHRAVLVGERSFGKGSFQEGEIWNRNRKIAFFQTKGFYYLPSGFSPQLRGLEPDVKVSFRDSLQLREEDQYVNPLSPPSLLMDQGLNKVDLSKCLSSGDGENDDEQLDKARTALFCGGTVAQQQGGSSAN